MHSSMFFRLFPPPRFMVMRHAGLDISDDSVRFLLYKRTSAGRRIEKFAWAEMPDGLISGGDIRDEKALETLISKFDKDNNITYAKVSVPEEKAYLFQTDVPDVDMVSIAQNIEFKLEENVPLTVADAVFYFDILPMSVTGGALRASVSVVPRIYIEKLMSILRRAGIAPIAFEVVPKSIAKAAVPPNLDGALLIIHVMNHKTGIYIVSGGVVCFTSTVAWGSKSDNVAGSEDISVLTKEVGRVYGYWLSHNPSTSCIKNIMLVGKSSPAHEDAVKQAVPEANLEVVVANVWNNVFSVDNYVPPISRDDSLDYAVAAGLAIEL